MALFLSMVYVSYPGSLNAQVLACGICEEVLVCIMNGIAYCVFGGKVSIEGLIYVNF